MKASKMNEQHMVHVVFISFRDKTDVQEINAIKELFSQLSAILTLAEHGVRYFAFEENIDKRKGIDFVELVIFKEAHFLDDFKDIPAHKLIVDKLRLVADWYVGDYSSWKGSI